LSLKDARCLRGCTRSLPAWADATYLADGFFKKAVITGDDGKPIERRMKETVFMTPHSFKQETCFMLMFFSPVLFCF